MLYPRIIGLETEYGCLVDSDLSQSQIVRLIRDWFFEDQGFGLIDQHHRGWDEPPGNGGFLFNGGRIYIDMGHIEYCTPECASLADVVRYDRAGDLLLLEALKDLQLQGKVDFFRNNVDHHTHATFGCHENYLLDRRAPLTEKNVFSLLAFQTLRVLFTGAGRVGSAQYYLLDDGLSPRRDPIPFQISQRADFIETEFYEWVQHNRSIVNTRDEPLADPSRYRRLHVLHGDTNVMPSALFLKIGATSLVLDLLEEDALPAIVLDDAVDTLRSLSRQTRPPWKVQTIEGAEVDAVELLYRFFECAKANFQHRDEETDAVLTLWENVLECLNGRLNELIGTIDWIGKKYLLEKYVATEGIGWNDESLAAQDLEYHHIDPERSYGLALANCDGIWAPGDLQGVLTDPPANSRASRRSAFMHELQGEDRSYLVNWDRIGVPEERIHYLPDPYAW